jgi:hypothetical protein
MAKIPDWSPYLHLFIALAAYCMTFALIMKKTILPGVNEVTLLFLNITLWYAFFSYRYLIPEVLLVPLLSIFIPLTAGTLLVAFADFVLGFWLTLVFYVWYLIIIVFIGTVQFPFWNLSFFFGIKVWEPLAAIDVFLSGALFSYVAVHATYVLALIPLPSKHQSFASRLEEVNEHAEMLVYRYSDVQLKGAEAACLLALFGGIYGLNYTIRVMPPSTLINLMVVLSPLLLGCIGRAFEKIASGESLTPWLPDETQDAAATADPAQYREIYAAALAHITSGSGKGELKRLLREAAELSAPFGRGDIPLISHIAGWLAWLGMHRQARSLFLRILVLEPRHFLAAAICFRHALEMGSRSTIRKYGSLLMNADYASHLRLIGNEEERDHLRIMDSQEEVVLTYKKAADMLSGMGVFHEAAKARQIIGEIRNR